MNAQLTAVLQDFLTGKAYDVKFKSRDGTIATVDGKRYFILPYNFSLPFVNVKSSKTEIQGVQQ